MGNDENNKTPTMVIIITIGHPQWAMMITIRHPQWVTMITIGHNGQ